MLKLEKTCEKCSFSREIEVKRGVARTFLLLRHGAKLCIPGVSKFYTLDVHSIYHGCTLGIPRGNILHKRGFSREIDVKRTNSSIYLHFYAIGPYSMYHRCTICIRRVYTWHTTGVHSPYHGCTLWLNGQYFHIKCPNICVSLLLLHGAVLSHHECTFDECTIAMPRVFDRHTTGVRFALMPRTALKFSINCWKSGNVNFVITTLNI